MIRRDGERLVITGPVTLANVSQLVEEARAPLAGGVRAVDLGEVTELDSSLLAVLIAWLREAKAEGRTLTYARLPQDLRTLAQLYGVAQLLPQDAAPS
jgi:phospholipid transport system transporter-binding protein